MPAPKVSERASLLLVDDSIAVLNFQKAALSNYYQLSTAMNGIEAIARLKESKPDAVVLDLSMPEMDGDEVLRFIRKNESLKDIGVLILSTEGQRARDCLALGADDFLLKPSKPEELRARVASALEQASRRATSRQKAFLFFCVGSMDLGLMLSEVERILPALALTPFPNAPAWLLGWFELDAVATAVIDFSRLTGLEHSVALPERKIIILKHERLHLGICVDEVKDPEELDRSVLEDPSALLPLAAESLKGRLEFMARASGGSFVPVIRASKFIDDQELEKLMNSLSLIKAEPRDGFEQSRKHGRRKNRL